MHEILPKLNQLQTRYRQLENRAGFSLNDISEITEDMPDAAREMQLLIRAGRNLAGQFATMPGIDWNLVAECAANGF